MRAAEHAQRKQVLSDALSNALRRSRLKDWLDPGALAHTLNTSLDTLLVGSQLDLVPLWTSLSSSYNPQALVGLFLRFRDEAERLGVQALLPAVIERMTPEQRRAHSDYFDLANDLALKPEEPPIALRSGDLTPLPTLEQLDVEPEPIPLDSVDVRPIIPEDLKRRITHAVVMCVKGSPIGWRVNSQQLRQLVTFNFEKLCDGVRFDFEPVLKVLLADEGVTEADAYIAVVRLIEQLRRMNVVMHEPAMKLGDGLRARLWEEAMRQAPEERPVPDEPAAEPRQKIRLGDLLVRYQLITPEQLQQGLRAQQTFGGRLGTALVDLGYIQETALAHFLGVQLGLPAVNPADVNALGPQVLSVLPPEIAKKYKVIPLSVENRKLRLAMIDPTDLEVLDEVAFLTGHRVQAVVAPESLIRYALERYYGMPRERRRVEVPTVSTVNEEFQVIHVSQRHRETPSRDLRPSLSYTPAALGPMAPPEAAPVTAPIVVDRDAFFDLDSADLIEDRTGITELTSALARSTGIPDVHRAVLDHFARGFARVAIFAPDGADIIGVGQHGCLVTDEHMLQLRFPMKGSDLFRQLYGSLKVHVGPPPHSTHDGWVLGSLGIGGSTPIVGIPLVEKQRVVSFVLAAHKLAGDVYQGAREYDRIAEKAGLTFQMISIRKQILQI
ncbi:hypothetical protein L6R52_22080 [Myxococcota bacterium]|nr:hypothetical protein [Myxococcota bacterium]